MHLIPFEADDVDEQTLGEAMLAHHRDRKVAALLGELEMTVTRHLEQSVALHASNRLAHGRTALLESFGDPRAERDDASSSKS